MKALFGCWATVSLLLPAGALRQEALITDYFDASKRDGGSSGWFVVTFTSCDFHDVSMLYFLSCSA